MPYVEPTRQQFAEYLNVDANNTAYLDEALAVALTLVKTFIGDTAIPQAVYANEVLRTAHAVYKQNETTGGSQQVQTLESVITTRFAKDPMTASYPILSKWVVPF